MADKPIPRRLRFEILRRDGHTCRYCGAQAPDVPLTVDHVIPRVLGGADDPTNLVTACRDCNAGKASTAPDQRHVDDVNQQVAEVDAAAMLFRQAMDRAGDLISADRAAVREAVDLFDQYWRVVLKGPSRSTDWEVSIRRFIAHGLDTEDLIEHAAAAVASPAALDAWRYFCGICWRDISERQELARRLIEDGAV